MLNFKEKITSLLSDCFTAIITTVLVDTGVKVCEGLIDSYLYSENAPEESEEYTLEDIINAIKTESETEDTEEEHDEPPPSKCDHCPYNRCNEE